jgi:protein-tyrosine phosphatase
VVSDDELRQAAEVGGTDASARVRAVAALVASYRGLVEPPADLDEDDVIDPYGRSWQTYLRSASQLVPAVTAVTEVISIALDGRAREGTANAVEQ